MSLFLKNLPKSFFRALVSSRPIFNKAKSLFSSIAINLQIKAPVCTTGKLHARSMFFGSEDKKKFLYKKYYSKKAGKTGSKYSSKLVNCEVKDGEMQCSINCKDEGGKGNIETPNPKLKIEAPNPKLKIIPRAKSSEQSKKCHPTPKDLTGTWMCKKTANFDFARSCKPQKDDSTKPFKLGEEKQECKKVSSKEAIQKSAASSIIQPCKENNEESSCSEKKKSEEKLVAPCGAKSEEIDPCPTTPEEKPDQSPILQSIDQCKKKQKSKKSKEQKSAKSEEIDPCPTSEAKSNQTPVNLTPIAQCIEKCKKQKSSQKKLEHHTPSGDESKEEPSETKPDQSPILQCVDKCKKKQKSPQKKSGKPPSPKKDKSKSAESCKPCKKKEKKKASASAKKTHSAKKNPKPASPSKEQVDSTKLLVTVYNGLKNSKTETEVDLRCQEIIAQLKRDLEECRKRKTETKKCMEPPKLDLELPKTKEQSKDLVSGSKDFLNSVREGILTKDAKAKKSQSEPMVKMESVKINRTKSADCKIDLKPQHCEKVKKTSSKTKKKIEVKESVEVKTTMGADCKIDLKPLHCEKVKETPAKTKEKVKVKESGKVKATESADCKIDLKPLHCEKVKETSKIQDKVKVCAESKSKAEEPKKKKKAKALCSTNKPEEKEKVKKVKLVTPCPGTKSGEKKKSKCSSKKKSKNEAKTCSKSKHQITTDLERIKIEAICARAQKPSEPEPECSAPEEPPDQSPIMQCIALCKKIKKADSPQPGKGTPPRDKKACFSDPEAFKKLVEYNGNQGEEKNKIFVPCMYEDIKSGVRSEEHLKIQVDKEENRVRRVSYSCPELKNQCDDVKKEEVDATKIEEQRMCVEEKNKQIVAQLQKENQKREDFRTEVEKTERVGIFSFMQSIFGVFKSQKQEETKEEILKLSKSCNAPEEFKECQSKKENVKKICIQAAESLEENFIELVKNKDQFAKTEDFQGRKITAKTPKNCREVLLSEDCNKHFVPPTMTKNTTHCKELVKTILSAPKDDPKSVIRSKHTDSPDDLCEKKQKEEIKIFAPCKYEKIKSALRKPDDEENEKFEDCKEEEKKKEECKEFVPAKYVKIKSDAKVECEDKFEDCQDTEPTKTKCETKKKSPKFTNPCPDLKECQEKSKKAKSSDQNECEEKPMELPNITPCKYEDIKRRIPYLRKPEDFVTKVEDPCQKESAMDEKERLSVMTKASNTSLILLNYTANQAAKEDIEEITKGKVKLLTSVFNALCFQKCKSSVSVKKKSKEDMMSKSHCGLKGATKNECKFDLNPKHCDQPKAEKPCRKEVTKKVVPSSEKQADQMENVYDPCKKTKTSARPTPPCKRTKLRSRSCGKLVSTGKEETKGLKPIVPCSEGKEENKAQLKSLVSCRKPKDCKPKDCKPKQETKAAKIPHMVTCGFETRCKHQSDKAESCEDQAQEKPENMCASDPAKAKIQTVSCSDQKKVFEEQDQSPIMQCIAYCRQKKNEEVQGAKVRPRKKKSERIMQDNKIRKAITECRDISKSQKRKEDSEESCKTKEKKPETIHPCKEFVNDRRRREDTKKICKKKVETINPCKDEKKICKEKKTCEADSEKMAQKSCRDSESKKLDRTKCPSLKFVCPPIEDCDKQSKEPPCPQVSCEEQKDSCEQEKEEIKEIFPCKPEETKCEADNQETQKEEAITPCELEESEVKKPEDHTECMKEEKTCKENTKQDLVVPCQHKESEEANKNEEIKIFVPCQHEEIKSGLRRPEDSSSEKTPYKTVGIDKNKCKKFAYVCEQNNSCPDKEEKCRKKEDNCKGKKRGKKDKSVCTQGVEKSSCQENKRQAKIFPCQDEGSRTNNEECSKSDTGKKEFTCKSKDERKETKKKMIVPCQFQKNKAEEDCGRSFKLIVPCRFDESGEKMKPVKTEEKSEEKEVIVIFPCQWTDNRNHKK